MHERQTAYFWHAKRSAKLLIARHITIVIVLDSTHVIGDIFSGVSGAVEPSVLQFELKRA